nr:phosphodiesterase [uncultured Holophaga sp.]
MAPLEDLHLELQDILGRGRLQANFQPILNLKDGSIHGFEGLIRGPSDSVLQSPLNLFRTARRLGLAFRLEAACCRTLVKAAMENGLGQRLFLNVSADSLYRSLVRDLIHPRELEELGISPAQIVIELTEGQPFTDYVAIREAVAALKGMGFRVALDDLGEGFSSLRLWSETGPDYVKIDKHFIYGASSDPVKLQFLKSLRDIARQTGAQVVAEGVELEADLVVVRDLELDFVQGYFTGRPHPSPLQTVSPEVLRVCRERRKGFEDVSWISQSRVTAVKLLQEVPPESPDTPVGELSGRFTRSPELQTIPIVQNGLPVGLINRHLFMDTMARPFMRELYGKKGCESLMERNILVVDQGTGLHDLSRMMVESDPRHILHGFILTYQGRYMGMGSGHDLMREITQMQIHAARYANPLTGLPGNVPISERLEELIAQRVPFTVCYGDLDHFKPYNDVYGFRRGDEVIHWTGKLLERAADPGLDFVGHIGGDDFILICRSPDAQERCLRVVEDFEAGRSRFFDPAELAEGGYWSDDRQGCMVFHPLLSLSIGILPVTPGAYPGHHEISSAASSAKREAKRMPGSSLFVERRAPATPARVRRMA